MSQNTTIMSQNRTVGDADTFLVCRVPDPRFSPPDRPPTVFFGRRRRHAQPHAAFSSRFFLQPRSWPSLATRT